MADRAFLERAIDQALGRMAADLVVKNARLLDVITGALTVSDIAICGDRIVGTHDSDYRGVREIDGRGLVAVPGFVDTHLHVESSLVSPHEFDRCVLPHGVTTAICDPHEIANVLGLAGIQFMLDSAQETVMDLRVQLSSCVPATTFETSGAHLGADDLLPLRPHPKVIGLAEVMSYPDVLAKEPGVLDKLAAFSDGHIDGHAPLVSGRALNAYLAAGIRTDHEATLLEEGREKLAKGMSVLIREGSVCKDLHALAPLIDANTSAFVAFCTDDRNPLEIAHEGHLDFMIRTAIAMGAPLHHVYRVASWSGANAFGLRDRGLLAPGKRADIVLLEDLQHCAVKQVIAAGRPVEPALFAARKHAAPVGLKSIKRDRVTPSDFRVPASGPSTQVIGIVPGKIITERVILDLPIKDGAKAVDLDKDAIKVAVIARHGVNRNIGRGFVTGFGLKRGAIASSMGHDSHNICVVGANDDDMAVAVNALIAMQGGFVVADGGSVTASLALPMAGLMATTSYEDVYAGLMPLYDAARALGCTLPEPFIQIAFLPLPVIPHLKITDFGLFDVDKFALVPA